MGWQDLLSKPDETVTVPWTGGREVRSGGRTFAVEGRLPKEHGWHEFRVTGPRKVGWKAEVADVDVASVLAGAREIRGYLVADRIVPDGAAVVPDATRIVEQTEPVYLIEPGLERFVRVRVVRHEDGRLIYAGQEFPLGPEGEVTAAFQDRKDSVTGISGVTPALDLAFRFEMWNRKETDRLRAEAEKLARDEAAKRAQAERRNQLVRQLGDAAGRREMARVDFGAAVAAALRVGNAELLDWRDSRVAGEAVVQFRFLARRYECVVQKDTLRVVDSGICLVDHATGRRDDTLLSIESLPGVIAEAIRGHKLVVFRHVDERGGYVRDDDEFHRDDEED